MVYRILHSVVFFWLIFATGCTTSKAPFPDTPVIEFVSIVPETVSDLGSFKITFSYTDGDGDVGMEDVENIFIHDNRLKPGDTVGTSYVGDWTYSMPNLTPDSRKPAIQGEVTVFFEEGLLGLIDCGKNCDFESFDFTIYIVDRSGNKSNEITTSKLTMLKP